MARCLFCGVANDSVILCIKCNKILPFSYDNYFAALGIDIAFNINLSDIHKKYLETQRLVHPDCFIGKTQQEQQIARDNSSYINRAFNTIKDSIKRLEYIISLREQDITRYVVPSDFLKTVFIWQSELMDSSVNYKKLRNNKIAMKQALLGEVQQQISDTEILMQIYAKCRYIDRFIETLDITMEN